MLIGKLSELTNVSKKAIRHYEEIGLIPVPARTGAYREYTEEYIPILRLIKKAQSVGFTLSELKEIVSKKSKSGAFPLKLALELIDTKINKINSEINHLQELKNNLYTLKENLKSTFEPS